MTKIQCLYDERNSNYCICPDKIITTPASDILDEINLDALQIRHKFANEQTVEVSEEVIRWIL